MSLNIADVSEENRFALRENGEVRDRQNASQSTPDVGDACSLNVENAPQEDNCTLSINGNSSTRPDNPQNPSDLSEKFSHQSSCLNGSISNGAEEISRENKSLLLNNGKSSDYQDASPSTSHNTERNSSQLCDDSAGNIGEEGNTPLTENGESSTNSGSSQSMQFATNELENKQHPESRFKGQKRKRGGRSTTSAKRLLTNKAREKIYEGSQGDESEAGTSSGKRIPSLPDLSDELLLVVLRSLTPRDLYSLSQASPRFSSVVADRTLWISPDFRHQRRLSGSQFYNQYLHFLGPWTVSIATRGPLISLEPPRVVLRGRDFMSKEVLSGMAKRCTKLTSMLMRDHRLIPEVAHADTLPSSLVRLTMRRCLLTRVTIGESYFSGVHMSLPHLQELEINRCPWFLPHSLMALSKCPHLRVLRITQCPGMVDSVPYISLSCRFGFKALEVLDLRQTPVGDPEVGCFSLLQRLEELLLERPGSGSVGSSDTESESEMVVRRGNLRGRPSVSGEGRNCVGGAACGCWGTGGRCSPPPASSRHACCGNHAEPAVNEDNNPSLTDSVSDTGLCSLGNGTRVAPGVVVVRMVGVPTGEHNPKLRRIVARGFSYVTDASVRYLALVASLRQLDLRGCNVTPGALENFVALRPEVEIVGP